MKSYKRIILKLSGEALCEGELILSNKVLDNIFEQIKELVKKHKYQVAIVVGGGNIWRGKNIKTLKMDREKADYMGMLATSINALGITSYFNDKGLKTRMQNSLKFEKISDTNNSGQAMQLLKQGVVIVYGGGTGRPFLSTDTAAAERAVDIEADAILMAKNNVDGLFTADPLKNKNAKFIEKITYDEMIEKKYGIVDLEAMKFLKNKNIDIVIFNMNKKNNIINLIKNPKTKKTLITN